VNKKLFYVLRTVSDRLRRSKVHAPRLTTELIIAHALNISRLDVLTSPYRALTPFEYIQIEALLQRRIRGEPLAYIISRRDFYGCELLVSPDVLIPRPESEKIIEQALCRFSSEDEFLYLDICTGCGNLAVALAMEFPNAKGLASDLSSKALKIAYKNLFLYNLNTRVQLLQGHLGLCFKAESIDLIVANPPYLSKDEIQSIPFEVKGYEPMMALDGGVLGYEKPLELLEQCHRLLKPGGMVIMEVGGLHLNRFKEIVHLQQELWQKTIFYRDNQGYDRILLAEKCDFKTARNCKKTTPIKIDKKTKQ